MTEEQFIHHLRKLAKTNSDLHVQIRALRLENTALKDDVDHYRREFARQNARLLDIMILGKMDDGD